MITQTNPTMGFAIYPYLLVFDDTFKKSANEIFANFFRKNADITKWMVFSDYAFYDKKKHSDVVTYSFIPYIQDFQVASELIDKASFKDIKSLSRVNDEFIKLIKNSPILNVTITLDRARRLSFDDERHDLFQTFEGLEKMLDSWRITTPEACDHYENFLSDIASLKEGLKKKNVNIKIIRDIYIISTLAAYLMFEVAKVIDVDKIGWFSDRDSLLSYQGAKFKSPIIFTLTHTLYHLFCEQQHIDSKNNPLFGVPETTGRVWYDAFIRIPDLICATLADYNPRENKFSHDKFRPVYENLLTSNDNNLFFKLTFLKDERTFQATRITLTRAVGSI